MGKGSSSIDTSGLEQATEEATALLQQNYQDILGYTSPYTGIGAQSVSKLADLLGLSGGSVLSEEQIYNNLLPQYTSQITNAPANTYLSSTGEVVNIGDVDKFLQDQVSGIGNGDISNSDNLLYKGVNQAIRLGNTEDALSRLGYTPYETTTESVNYDALNAAVAEQLANQGTPDDYGSLLQTFGMDQFEEDPAYQYRQSEAQTALERAMAAQGVTLGGAGMGDINPQVAEALLTQNQAMASEEYSNAYNRYVNDQANIYNMLMGTSGLGQGALNTVANTATGTTTAINDLNTSFAQAQLNAEMAEASQPSMFDTLLGTGLTLGTAYLTGGGSLFGSSAGGLFSSSTPMTNSGWASFLASN